MLKISVITVSFNQGRFIRENIESVLNQNYPNFEHIIIDGGSRDDTVSILKEYPHLDWVSEPDRGQSDGLNKGFRKATGDIIAWINSDDFVAPGAFQVINEFFEKNHDKFVLTGNQVIIDAYGNILETISAKTFDSNYLLNAPKSSVMQNSTIFRKVVLDEVGLLDEKYHYTMDHELFVRIALKFKSYAIDKDIAFFRMWEESKTATSQIKFYKELVRLKLDYHAKIFSVGNVWLCWQFVKEPFKRIHFLRKLIRTIKGVQ